MTRLATLSASTATLLQGVLAASLLLAPADASAQAPPLPGSVTIGAWAFRPSVELRIRGEYLRNPATFSSTPIPVLTDGYKESLPVNYGAVYVDDVWGLTERARIGIAVDRGPVTGVLLLQDARVLGHVEGVSDSGFGGLGSLSGSSYGLTMQEAYVDVHSRSGRPMFLRIGRQKVVWGDGRLVGESDWSLTPRALDAARFGFHVGDIDIEMMAALLVPPYMTNGDANEGSVAGTWPGAQLYGLDVKWRLLPLFNAEVSALSRVARLPWSWDYGAGVPLASGDTYVVSARLFGDRRGFRYAVEGAYELGRVASYGINRDIGAFAVAGRASLETALPGHIIFGAQGAYASGDEGSSDAAAKQTRFDPILPDEFSNHSPMGLYAWSNLIEAGGDVKVTPIDELSFLVGYRFAALASPSGRWTTSLLSPVGASDANGSRVLGHEVDAAVTFTPWEPIEFRAGYGLFFFGDKAKAILSGAEQTASMQHWAFLQTIVRAP